jgi:hypothetical protein
MNKEEEKSAEPDKTDTVWRGVRWALDDGTIPLGDMRVIVEDEHGNTVYLKKPGQAELPLDVELPYHLVLPQEGGKKVTLHRQKIRRGPTKR